MLPINGISLMIGISIFNAFKSKSGRMIFDEFIMTNTKLAMAVDIILIAKPIMMTLPFMVTPKNEKIRPYIRVEPMANNTVSNIFPVK